MTREEAKEFIAQSVKSDVDMTLVADAIKALEQEPILDKIKTEIEHLTITEGGEDYTRKMAELYSLKIKVLQIIEKCIAEKDMEDKNENNNM